MSVEDWFARYEFCAPVGQCGLSLYFLGWDTIEKSFVLIKQYTNTTEEQGVNQLLAFQDDAHLYGILKESGLVSFFDHQAIGKRFFLVVDVESASRLMCSHIEPEAIEKSISEYKSKMTAH